MTQTTILLFTLGMLAGLPAGYWLAWVVDLITAEIDALLTVCAMFDCLDAVFSGLDSLPLHITEKGQS